MKNNYIDLNSVSGGFSLKNNWFRPGISLWLGIALGILIIALALTIAAALESIARREVMKVSAQNLENISRQMAREISFGMTRFAKEVETMALLPTLRNPVSSTDEIRSALDQFVALHPEFAYVGVIDIQTGIAIAANARLFEGGNLRDRPVFQNGRKGLFLGDVHPAVRLAELLPKLPNGEGLRFLDIALPITDANGAKIRVLATHISFEWTRQLREQILSPMKDTRGIEALLVDSAGKVVLSPNESIRVGTPIVDLLKNKPSHSEIATVEPWSGDAAYLTASSAVLPNGAFDGFGWKVVVRQPESLAMAPAAAIRSPFFLGAALLGCMAAALAWLLANRVTRPMVALAETASRINDTDETPTNPSGIEEIDRAQVALAGLVRDRRRQSAEIENRERRFSVFADLMPHLVFEADANGYLEYANRQWVGQFGPYEGMSLTGLGRSMPKEDREILLQAWKQARTEGTELEALARLMVGIDQPQWFKIKARPMFDKNGLIERWIGTLSNENESILAAENLQKALECEKATRLKLERISLMKDEFLATLSHELRTPLNVIGGWAQMFETRANDVNYVIRGAGIIRRNIDLQAALIDGLLDMSAITAGKVNLNKETVNVGQLLTSTHEAFSKLASNKGLTLRLELPERPLKIQADARRMSQIISNLVSNAVKFTEHSGLIKISTWYENSLAYIQVSDTGCGITAEFLPYVFDRFRQQDSSMSRKKEGVGLGLAIAKSLTELQGGKITVHSEGQGKGCVFSLAFPLDLTSSIQLATILNKSSYQAKLDGVRVLLVEDNADAREMTRDALRTLGASVECAENAAAALKWLTDKTFDLLVCDIGMPGMDGYALMRLIRNSADPKIAGLPSIALTAYAMRHDVERAKEAGFQQHVSKPWNLVTLSTAAEDVLRSNGEVTRGNA